MRFITALVSFFAATAVTANPVSRQSCDIGTACWTNEQVHLIGNCTQVVVHALAQCVVIMAEIVDDPDRQGSLTGYIRDAAVTLDQTSQSLWPVVYSAPVPVGFDVMGTLFGALNTSAAAIASANDAFLGAFDSTLATFNTTSTNAIFLTFGTLRVVIDATLVPAVDKYVALRDSVKKSLPSP